MGLDSWVAPHATLTRKEKATLAIDAISNELPEWSTIPYEFLELAVLELQESTDNACAAVQQRNKTIAELRALCDTLERRLEVLAVAPPLPSISASTAVPVAMQPTDWLCKPQDSNSESNATSLANPSAPRPPSALSALPSGALIGSNPSSVPMPPVAPLASPSGTSVGPVSTPAAASYGRWQRRLSATSVATLNASAPQSIPTHPVALLTPSTPPFHGRRGTKPNELHIQFKSCAEFNTKLMWFHENNVISHCHALLDALFSAISLFVTDETVPLFNGNKLRAAFWSPRGNLIVRFLKTPSPDLISFFLDSLTAVCGAKDFTILNRPALSFLKITKMPTRSPDGASADLQQIALDLLSIPELHDASFWHTPRFVSFKGAPIGQDATLFFSITDSPQYTMGRSIVGLTVQINGRSFKVKKWHHAKLPSDQNVPVGKHTMFKETTGLLPPSRAHYNMSHECFTMLMDLCNNFVSPPPLLRSGAPEF